MKNGLNMTTLEEIRKLSEQYAELTDGSPVDKAYIRSIAQCYTEWLFNQYCIVPKCKLIEKVKNTKWMKEHGRAFEAEVREELLSDIFGRSLFGEDK